MNSFKYNKLQNPDFINVIKNKRIFSLIETHHTADESDSLYIEGYKCFSICRPKPKNKKRYKPSGGLAAYVHTSILSGVEKLSFPGSESIILKLKKNILDYIMMCTYALHIVYRKTAMYSNMTLCQQIFTRT